MQIERIERMWASELNMTNERTCETCIHYEIDDGQPVCIVGPEPFPLEDTSPCTDGLWIVGDHTADYWSYET